MKPPRVLDEPVVEARDRSTPGDFLKNAGLVIAVCLGLALLARMLVMMVGES